MTRDDNTCAIAIAPMQISCLYSCALTQHRCCAVLLGAKSIPYQLVLLCKTDSKRACVTANTPMKISCLHKYALTQH